MIWGKPFDVVLARLGVVNIGKSKGKISRNKVSIVPQVVLSYTGSNYLTLDPI